MFHAAVSNPAPPNPVEQISNGFSVIDDSLTDIRWLGSMDANSFPSLDRMEQRHRMLNRSKGRICKKLSYGKKDSKDEVDNIRPPFSYAALIALAINSHPQKMLTLNSIYRWIEDNFPFFRMPAARAWKNSIRHNLSIKKNLFQKVYVDPPRRGSGAYWTLLTEGVEEVERCTKLLTTLRPPIIDPSSIYLTQGSSSSQVIRSRGQFIPSSSESSCTQQVEVKTDYDVEENKENLLTNIVPEEAHPLQLVHPLEHNYTYPRAYPPSIQPYNPSTESNLIAGQVQVLHNDAANNSSLLDLSFLTPLKDDYPLQNIDLNSISFSPMFSYLTPKDTSHATPIKIQPGMSPLSTPLKPFGHITGENDSGVFLSPGGLKFSTPIKDLNDFLHGYTPRHDNGHYHHLDSSVPLGTDDLKATLDGSL